ncbi:polysaccharide export protein EpsE [Hymenobacter busanensis]|uniref:Polysaccharide export protein EpsE n=1 Tax=Hymenobacter busanensis TaxID=2607656 RepID=A0A7L5A1C0_9BACT|nr:polysaccharide biosynthesis/export family protein [Hymenobacter busanensis]KAA9331644.1 polysaccharide export protein EpsE [Hymenobacter busanensis]QHJ08795.1 polysaccharide export protein EpsE [Hymenobacter busanensis]
MRPTFPFRALHLPLLAVLLALLASCASSRAYRQNILFRTDDSAQPDTSRLKGAVMRVEGTYRIRANDYLEVRVYTNQGERLIDPNGELGFGAPGSQSTGNSTTNTRASSRIATGLVSRPGMSNTGAASGPAPTDYLVHPDGSVVLPVVYRVQVAGYTVPQLDSLLQVRYEQFYKGVFVQSRVTNNRVIVLGTPGGAVVPVTNENMNLLEVLATVGGIDGGGITGGNQSLARGGKAYNIRLIRPAPNGDLKTAQVQIIDLTTIEGMRRANLRVQPNDVVYIEPLRRPFFEALQDINPVLGLVSSLTSLALFILLK